MPDEVELVEQQLPWVLGWLFGMGERRKYQDVAMDVLLAAGLVSTPDIHSQNQHQLMLPSTGSRRRLRCAKLPEPYNTESRRPGEEEARGCTSTSQGAFGTLG